MTIDLSAREIDQSVGQRLRLARKLSGIGQKELAAGLRVSYQQLQKYERGYNRISAGRLYEAAGILGMPFPFFYEDLELGGHLNFPNDLYEQLTTEDSTVQRLVALFFQIESAAVKNMLLAFIECLVQEQHLPAEAVKKLEQKD